MRQEAIAGARRLAAIAELTRRRTDDDDERRVCGYVLIRGLAHRLLRWVRRWRSGRGAPSGQIAHRRSAARASAPGRGAVRQGCGEYPAGLDDHLGHPCRSQGEQVVGRYRSPRSPSGPLTGNASSAREAAHRRRCRRCARFDPDAQRRTETAVRGQRLHHRRDLASDDTDTVSVFGSAAGPGRRGGVQQRGSTATGQRAVCRSIRAAPVISGAPMPPAAIADRNDALVCRCGSPTTVPTAGVTPLSNVVIRVIAESERHHRRHHRERRPVARRADAPGYIARLWRDRRRAGAVCTCARRPSDPQRSDHQGEPAVSDAEARAAVSAQRRSRAEFVRMRDLFVPLPRLRSSRADRCDFDHARPFNHADPRNGGLTLPSNLQLHMP